MRRRYALMLLAAMLMLMPLRCCALRFDASRHADAIRRTAPRGCRAATPLMGTLPAERCCAMLFTLIA